MIDNIRERVAAILLTAILLFSATFVMTVGNVAAASETNDITIKVKDYKQVDIAGATVKFTEVHTGQVINAIYWTNESTYHAPSSPSGHYRIDITATGYYGMKNINGFTHDGITQTDLPNVVLTKIGDIQYTYSVAVKDKFNNPISGATVKFYNRTMKQDVSSNTTDLSGNTNLKAYGGASLDLVVSAITYEMNVTNFPSINSSGSITIQMDDSVVVYGDARKASGGYAKNVVSYMYNIDPTIPWEKKILKSTGSSVRFDAYPGTWIIVIDGSDVDPIVLNQTISSSTPLILTMATQNQSSEDTKLTFSSWNQVDLTTTGIWKADKSYFGLDYSDMGALRAQVDIALGNADGIVSFTEWSLISTLLNTHGPNYVTTSGLIHVDDANTANKTQYANRTVNLQVVGNFAGSVTAATDISYSSDISLETQVALPTNDSAYTAQMIMKYDSASMNRVFTLDLVNGFELVDNTTLTSKVSVKGYENVTVDPLLSATTGSETITLAIQKSLMPIVKSAITTGSYAYAKRNATNVLLYYVVKNNTAVTFTGLGSSDPNDNPLTYIWNFGDSGSLTTTNVTCTHNYTAGARNLTVSLTVRDVTLKTNTTNFKLNVDSRLPRVQLKVYNMTMALKTGSPVTIDQQDSLKFNPNGTVDDLKLLNDGFGEVYYYEWKFGNTTPIRVMASDTANITVTHKFETAGDIKVVLNVTDLVGNWKNATTTIRVKDKTGPTVQLTKILNATWGSSIIERVAVHFDATKTTDNIDNISALHFAWDFGDDSTTSTTAGNGTAFANVTHTYSTYGQYRVFLNVTDTSGNNASLTRTVYVGAGPRPNLEVLNISFEPTVFEEGLSGQIKVWITNDGSAMATANMTVEIWYYSGTEAQKKIGTITQFRYQNGTTVSKLGIEQEAYGVFNWIPDARGNYTIRAIANCTDQKQSNWKTDTVEVNEAGWKKIALYVGIIVILIVFPLIIIARRRIASMGGLRREKPEKEAKEKKKEKEKEG